MATSNGLNIVQNGTSRPAVKQTELSSAVAVTVGENRSKEIFVTDFADGETLVYKLDEDTGQVIKMDTGMSSSP